jgi:protocatechuate 3,4-dioxygenase beta subunit
MLMVRALFFSCLVVCAVAAQTQTSSTNPSNQATAKGTITGRAIDKASGQPLKKVTVLIRRADASSGGGPRGRLEQPQVAMTDTNGHYSIQADAGQYRLMASRNGYVRQAWGQKDARRPGTILTVAEGQTLKDIDFDLVPGGVIAGRVVDEDGEPMSNVMIQVLRATYQDGERRLENAGNAARSDDRGEYRIFGLPARKYYVSASRRGGSDGMGVFMFVGDEGPVSSTSAVAEGYATTFYPGTTEMGSAAPIEVRAAEEQRVNFTMVPTRVFKVSGRALDAGGQPVRQGMAMLMSRSGGFMMGPSGFSPIQNGKFEIRGVTPGSYFVMATTRDEETQAARRDVEVADSDVDNVNLNLSEGTEIRGSIKFVDFNGKQPDVMNIMLQPKRAGMFFGMTSGSAKADGNFVLKNVFPEDYVTTISNLPADAFVKSVKVGGDETVTSGFNGAKGGTMEIVISGRAGKIEGTVMDADGKPFAGATVVLTSDKPIRSRRSAAETTSTDQYGHFTFRGLRPADYQVGAFQDIDEEEYSDPDFAKRQGANLSSVRLSEGESQTKDLKLATTETHTASN